jgi:hypothetical protein
MTLFELINRTLTFSLERHWIDYIAYVMEYHLPKFDRKDWLGQFVHILFVSMVLLGVSEVFRVLGVRQLENERNRLETQLVLLQSQRPQSQSVAKSTK